jgi:N utilization substance protein A
VRLASQLTRYDIDILTEAEESERRQEDFRKRSGLFVEGLDVDDVIAGLLVTEGFGSIEEIINVEDEELGGIEGFDETIAAELKRRASAFLEKRDGELDEKRRELGVDDAVAEVGGFSPAMLVALGEKGVKTLEDLADLAGDELIEILGAEALDEETANAVIMAARQSAGWFGDEPPAEDGGEDAGGESGEEAGENAAGDGTGAEAAAAEGGETDDGRPG